MTVLVVKDLVVVKVVRIMHQRVLVAVDLEEIQVVLIIPHQAIVMLVMVVVVLVHLDLILHIQLHLLWVHMVVKVFNYLLHSVILHKLLV